jgi:DNA (cytosine-5)-methyltransferase 1
VENVSALLVRGMERVLGDLASIGYDAEWDCIPAFAFGAPHRRDRVWIVAYPCGTRLEGLRFSIGVKPEISRVGEHTAIANTQALKGLHSLQQRGIRAEYNGSPDRIEWGGQQWPETRRLLYRVDDGLPNWAHRISCLGNAVVPQITEWIGRRIVDSTLPVAVGASKQ